MAKVMIEVDTETAEMTVNIAGEQIQNVTSVSIYKFTEYDGEAKTRVNVSTRVENEETEVIKYEEYVCSKDRFVKSDKTKALQDIAKYFGVK